jgi:RHS repeat-associated protein
MQPTCVDHATQNSSGQCQATQYSLFSLTYGHTQNNGNNGQITTITDGVDSGRTVNYTFDALNRITSAVTNGSTTYPQWGLSWGYDRYGNRPSQTVTAGSGPSISVSVDATTNRINTSGYSYDADGHLTNDGVNALTYDAEDRIVSTSGTLGSATYSHRPTGQRVMKTSGSNTTVYIYSQNRLIAEYVNGALTEEYIYLGHRLIAEYAGGTLYYHHGDHLSDRMITDASGNKVGEQAHYPFGETWYSNNTTTKFHLTSYERDAESGNDYARHRFHVNRLGRFSSADPIEGCERNPQGLNRFTYVGNDPINRTDPMGLCWNIWLPCCTSWWGCGMDDEGDNGHCCAGGGACDPSVDPLDPACGEPPQPPPDPCLVFAREVESPPSTVICNGSVVYTSKIELRDLNGNIPNLSSVTYAFNPSAYIAKKQLIINNTQLEFEQTFTITLPRYTRQRTVSYYWEFGYTCGGNPTATRTQKRTLTCGAYI